MQIYRKEDRKLLPCQLHVINDSSLLSTLSPMVLLNLWYLYTGIVSKRIPFSLLWEQFLLKQNPKNILMSTYFIVSHYFDVCIKELSPHWCIYIQYNHQRRCSDCLSMTHRAIRCLPELEVWTRSLMPKRSVKPSENPSKLGFFWGEFYGFCFWNTAG